MPLADILKSLIGIPTLDDKGQAKSGTTQPGDIYTPGVEGILSAVPALIGSFEAAKGRPIGAPLEALGNLGLTNAANRQKQHQSEGDVAAQIEALAGQGLAPPQGTLDAVNQMTPENAEKTLEDYKSRAYGQQQHQQTLQEAAQRQAIAFKKPFFLSPSSTEAYVRQPDGTPVRAPQYDKPAGAEAKTEMQLYQTNKAKWSQYMADKLKFQISGADTKLLDRANTLLNFQLDKTPIPMLTQLKNSVLYDRETMRPVNPTTISARQALAPGSRYVFVDRKTATETIPNLSAARQQIIRLASDAAQVLPGDAGNTYRNWMNTFANRWRIAVKARAGGVSEAMFGADRTSAALQLQKAFTGSTRPVNLVEFTRITGDDTAGLITSKDIDAVLPTGRETKEQAQAKLNVLQQMFDQKLSDLNMDSGAPGVYFKSVNDAMNAASSTPEAPEPAETPAPTEAPTPDTDDGAPPGAEIH